LILDTPERYWYQIGEWGEKATRHILNNSYLAANHEPKIWEIVFCAVHFMWGVKDCQIALAAFSANFPHSQKITHAIIERFQKFPRLIARDLETINPHLIVR
jgi:hypothetical protein